MNHAGACELRSRSSAAGVVGTVGCPRHFRIAVARERTWVPETSNPTASRSKRFRAFSSCASSVRQLLEKLVLVLLPPPLIDPCLDALRPARSGGDTIRFARGVHEENRVRRRTLGREGRNLST